MSKLQNAVKSTGKKVKKRTLPVVDSAYQASETVLSDDEASSCQPEGVGVSSEASVLEQLASLQAAVALLTNGYPRLRLIRMLGFFLVS